MLRSIYSRRGSASILTRAPHWRHATKYRQEDKTSPGMPGADRTLRLSAVQMPPPKLDMPTGLVRVLVRSYISFLYLGRRRLFYRWSGDGPCGQPSMPTFASRNCNTKSNHRCRGIVLLRTWRGIFDKPLLVVFDNSQQIHPCRS